MENRDGPNSLEAAIQACQEQENDAVRYFSKLTGIEEVDLRRLILYWSPNGVAEGYEQLVAKIEVDI